MLLADDHDLNRIVAEAALRGLGAAVTAVTDGAEALAAFAPGRFSAIVLDVRMPNMDGHRAAQEIRRIESEVGRARVPILALTSDASVDDRLRAMDSGMDDHMAKPFRADVLAETLGRLIAAAQAEPAIPPIPADAPLAGDGG